MSDRAAIEDLMSRYTHAYDFGRLDDMKALLTEDATMTIRVADGDLVGPFAGRDAIVQMMTDAHEGQADRRRHVMSNLALDVDGDAAHAVSYLTLLSVAGGAVRMLTVGTYEDELVRQDGQWLFASRHIALELPY